MDRRGGSFKQKRPKHQKQVDSKSHKNFVRFSMDCKAVAERTVSLKLKCRRRPKRKDSEHQLPADDTDDDIEMTAKSVRSNSFIYSSSSDSEDEDVIDISGPSELSRKLSRLSLTKNGRGNQVPEFVKHIKKPRRLTFGEIRSLHVSEKFVREAHKMIFYPPNLAFAPKIWFTQALLNSSLDNSFCFHSSFIIMVGWNN